MINKKLISAIILIFFIPVFTPIQAVSKNPSKEESGEALFRVDCSLCHTFEEIPNTKSKLNEAQSNETLYKKNERLYQNFDISHHLLTHGVLQEQLNEVQIMKIRNHLLRHSHDRLHNKYAPNKSSSKNSLKKVASQDKKMKNTNSQKSRESLNEN